MRALLLSNSTNVGGTYLGHARGAIAEHFAGASNVIFVPWALKDLDAYTRTAAAAFEQFGIAVRGIHTFANPREAIEAADGIFVGGGNTFRLVARLQETGALAAIRTAVAGGMPYMGASAGTNIASPTLKTTNDMPIRQPESFETLGLIPFQINPHYVDPDPNRTHAGETREERILQFLEDNDVPVLGLREGTFLTVTGESAVILGESVEPGHHGPARLFEPGAQPREVSGDVSFLLRA